MACTVTRGWEAETPILRLAGTFDRPAAWSLREQLERELAPELVLDFCHISAFSDLAVAVLAQGVHSSRRRLLLRGLRQHQLRIFRYCGVQTEDAAPAGTVAARTGGVGPVAPSHPRL